VIARGGGSVEDLLPFSNESLVRAVFAAHTPVVSAIGHETDVPLLDYVADVAASTPTDAARRIVPDLQEELLAVAQLRQRAADTIARRIERETELMAGLPERMRAAVRGRLAREVHESDAQRDRIRRRLAALLQGGVAELAHLRAQIRSLSPQATLDRGYAVVRRPDGTVVRDAAEALGLLHIRVARGEFDATVP
jgi:exodeoxyribonuclease VII large subunit